MRLTCEFCGGVLNVLRLRGVRRSFKTLRATGMDALNARFEEYFREYRMPPILAVFLGSPDGRIPAARGNYH